jgi:hypothetical protein
VRVSSLTVVRCVVLLPRADRPMEGGASIPGSASSQSLNSVDRERERNNSLSPREKLTRGRKASARSWLRLCLSLTLRTLVVIGSSSNSAAPALPPAPSPPPPGTASGRSPRDNKKGPLNSSPRNVNGPAAAASAAAATAAGGAGPGPGGRLRGATPQSLRRSFTGWCAGKGKSPRLEAGSPKKPSLRKQSERRRSHPRK